MEKLVTVTKKMIQAALDNWDFDGYMPDPEVGKDAKRGLEFMEKNFPKYHGLRLRGWDGLGEFAENLGYELSH